MTRDREDLEAMLFFLANDTLEGEEKAEIEAAVAADADLAEQLSVLRAMRTTMQAEEEVQSPGEFGLARLQRDIRQTGRAPVAANVNAPRTSGLWRIAAMVAVTLLAAQSLYLVSQSGVDDLTLAGVEQSLDFALQVGFVQTATEAEIRTLLLDGNLVIVDGPSALGLYTLTTPDPESREAAFAYLEAQDALVEFVEEIQ